MNAETIAADVVARLIAASTSAGARVAAGRVLPIDPEDLESGGVIAVWALREEYQHVGQSPVYQVSYPVRVEAWATAADEDAMLAAFAAYKTKIKAALFGSDFREAFERIERITIETESGQMADGAAGLAGVVRVEFTATDKAVFEPPASESIALESISLAIDMDPHTGAADVSAIVEITP